MDKFSVNTPFVILISEDPNVRAFFAALRGIQCTAGARPMLDSLPDLGDRPVIVALDVDDFGGPALLSRALSKLENVPVIVIAPRSQAHTVKTALNLGAFDHLEKPLDPDLAHFALKRATGFLELRNLKSYFEKMLDETLQERIGEVTRKSDLLQGILNSSTLVSIVVTDTDQNVLFWNTGAQNIFGYTANEMIGSKITKLYIPDADSTEVVRTLQSEVKTRFGTVYGKMRQLTKDGRVVTVSLALSPTRDSSGANTGILGIGLDVTEEERLNEQLIEKNIELQ
jgi:PAS domain S-box-containing protein